MSNTGAVNRNSNHHYLFLCVTTECINDISWFTNHTFSDEHEKVNNVVFEEALGIKQDDIDKKKYNVCLTLYEKDDTHSSLKEFKEFIQNEIQHKKKEPWIIKTLRVELNRTHLYPRTNITIKLT